MATLGDNLRTIREAKGWSRSRLSQESGIGEGNIEGIELGHRGKRPSVDVVMSLARALNVKPWELWPELEDLAPTEVSTLDMIEELRRRCEALDLVPVRVVGVVPSTAEVRGQYTPTQIELPRSRLREEGGNVFALEVAEALSEEGIDIGDYVVVAPEVPVDERGNVFVIEVKDTWHLARVRKAGSYLHVSPTIAGVSCYPETSVTVVGRAVLGGRWREL